MRILVDTSIWSFALRRKIHADADKENLNILKELKELINESRVMMIGPIRQEILSGISQPIQYKKLRDKLRAFEDSPLATEDYELAADLYNRCRKQGIQGSQIDFLIAAAAIHYEWSIFTLDKDFANFTKILDLKIHQPRRAEHFSEHKPD